MLPKLTEPQCPVSWALYPLSNIMPMDPGSHFGEQVHDCLLITPSSAEGSPLIQTFLMKPDIDRAGEGF
jgi:hypothetical protein